MAQSNSLLDLDTLERISTLVWASTGDSQMAAKVATVRLVSDLWGKISSEKEMDALRNATILKIATYVKEHPKASKDELAKAVGKEIKDFAEKVKAM